MTSVASRPADEKGSSEPGPPAPADLRQVQFLAALVVVGVVLQPALAPRLASPAFQNAATVFVAVAVQALPFLALGVVVSGAIAAYVPTSALARALPKRMAAAVPVAGLAGAALPGCECGSVPIAARLVERGVPAPAALTFLLSAPAINPVVMVSTAVAFPGQPRMVVARGLAGLATSTVVGLVWSRLGPGAWTPPVRAGRTPKATKAATFADTALHDFLHAGGFLVVGAVTAAVLQTVVPKSLLDSVVGSGVTAVVVMAALAVLLAVCSEADAFVASSLTSFSLTSRLVFLVVGPVVDVKLVALQAGTFGRSFAARFAPLTLVVAVGCALVIGWWLL